MASDRFEELPEDDAARVEKLLHAVDLFRDIDTAFPASYMAAFLLVALKPGRGATDYAKDLGLAQAVTSRMLLEIGQKSRHGGEGLGWVDSVADPSDLRTRKCYLTVKGKAQLRRILRALGASVVG